MRTLFSSSSALWIGVIGMSMLIFGDFFISALPRWTGYFPIPGIMLAHIRGIALLSLSLLLWHRETARTGSLLLILFALASFTPSFLGVILALATMLPVWKHYRSS